MQDAGGQWGLNRISGPQLSDCDLVQVSSPLGTSSVKHTLIVPTSSAVVRVT